MFSERWLYPSVTLRSAVDKLNWVGGNRLTAPTTPIRFETDVPEGFEWPDFVRPAANIPLVSPALRGSLQRAGVENVDYYAAEVVSTSTGQTRPYLAANIIGLVSAMDRSASQFTPFRGSPTAVRSIERLVLDERQCARRRIFRLAEFDLLVVVDDAVKNEIEAAGLRGVGLLPPENWDGFQT